MSTQVEVEEAKVVVPLDESSTIVADAVFISLLESRMFLRTIHIVTLAGKIRRTWWVATTS
jgi:hypothetical protein